MPDSNLPSLPVSTEILTATCTLSGSVSFRNAFWKDIFGDSDDPWHNLSPEDREEVETCISEAATGSLVTNRIFFVHNPLRDNLLPVLMHFLPVRHSDDTDDSELVAITLTGEVLAEPGSTIINQTQRSRFENLGRMTLGSIHNINNYLASILGSLEIIQELALITEEDADLASYLHNIRRAASDGAGITRRIQDYMRNEVREEGRPVNLSALLDECKDLTEPYWNYEPRRKGIIIQTKMQLKEVPFLLGNEGELREVFINIIQNAIHAMPEGGDLVFATWLDEANQVCASIQDTGSGIPPSVLNRIFDPLFTTKGEKGNGMGLAVSEGIVKRHHGSIQVETEPGKGTTFCLCFPAIDTPASENKPVHQSHYSHPVRVLAVDDEEGIRSVIHRLLKLKGHTVTVASSGQEALDIMETQSFDIVFTDLGMPGMNGRQLAAAIRTKEEDMPIVLLSGDTELGSHSATISAILAKPFTLSDLLDAIYTLVPAPVEHPSPT